MKMYKEIEKQTKRILFWSEMVASFELAATEWGKLDSNIYPLAYMAEKAERFKELKKYSQTRLWTATETAERALFMFKLEQNNKMKVI